MQTTYRHEDGDTVIEATLDVPDGYKAPDNVIVFIDDDEPGETHVILSRV